jgi:hypothetical protein
MARNISMDIFGREKMPADARDYKKGAGSYELDMTTLYVHYGGAGHYAVPQLRHLLLQVRHACGTSLWLTMCTVVAFCPVVTNAWVMDAVPPR